MKYEIVQKWSDEHPEKTRYQAFNGEFEKARGEHDES